MIGISRTNSNKSGTEGIIGTSWTTSNKPEKELLAIRIKIRQTSGQYRKLIALIDTGAYTSLIEEDFVKQFDLYGELEDTPANVCSVNGDRIHN